MISISGYVLCHSSTMPLLYIITLPVTSTPPIPSDVTLFVLTSPFITTAFVMSYMVSPCLNIFGKTTSAGQQNALTSRIITLIFFIVCKIFYYFCVAAVGDAPVRATELIYFPAYRRRQSVTLLPSALCRDCFTLMRNFSIPPYQAKEIGMAVCRVCSLLGIPCCVATPLGNYDIGLIKTAVMNIARSQNIPCDLPAGPRKDIREVATAFQSVVSSLVAANKIPAEY